MFIVSDLIMNIIMCVTLFLCAGLPDGIRNYADISCWCLSEVLFLGRYLLLWRWVLVNSNWLHVCMFPIPCARRDMYYRTRAKCYVPTAWIRVEERSIILAVNPEQSLYFSDVSVCFLTLVLCKVKQVLWWLYVLCLHVQTDWVYVHEAPLCGPDCPVHIPVA